MFKLLISYNIIISGNNLLDCRVVVLAWPYIQRVYLSVILPFPKE